MRNLRSVNLHMKSSDELGKIVCINGVKPCIKILGIQIDALRAWLSIVLVHVACFFFFVRKGVIFCKLHVIFIIDVTSRMSFSLSFFRW